MKLTPEQRESIDNFLFNEYPLLILQPDDYERMRTAWARGGRSWGTIGQGGTGQCRLILWYQNIYRPYSKEWRPRIIINALLACIQ